MFKPSIGAAVIVYSLAESPAPAFSAPTACELAFAFTTAFGEKATLA